MLSHFSLLHTMLQKAEKSDSLFYVNPEITVITK